MTDRREAVVVGPAVLFVLLFAVAPAALLFGGALASAGGLSGLVAAFSTRTVGGALNRAAVENSLVQGGLSAGLAVALGYPAGIFLGRYRWPMRSTVRSLLLVPFLMPSLIVVFGVVDLFGASGVLSTLLPSLGFFGSGLPAIVAANLVFNIPLVVLFTATGVESASAELEETVATLGGSPWRAYRDAWARPSWVGAAVGGLLTFLFSALSFAPPILLCGSRCYTVEAQIYSLDAIRGLSTEAGVLAFAMVVLFLVPTVLYLLLLGRLRSVPGRRTPTRSVSLRDPVSLALAVETGAVLVGVLGVLAAVLYRTVAPVGGVAPGVAWSELFSSSTAARTGVPVSGLVANSLLFATGATVLALLVGIVLGYTMVGRPARRRALGVLLFLPLLISPVVLAFALSSFWLPLLGGATNVWVLVIVCQAILALPFALQSIEIPLAGLSPRAHEAAESLGASSWNAFLDADLPRVRDGLATAGLFAFALGLGEFTATNFLVTPQYTTLTVALYDLDFRRSFAVVDAAAGLLLLLSLAVFLVLLAGGRRVEL